LRAAVLQAPRQLTLRSVPDPGEPGIGDVRVQLEGAGICASELPVWEGREWFSYPLAPGEPGHEGWGVVEELGADVGSLSVGERVAFIGSGTHTEKLAVAADRCVSLNGLDCGFPGEPLACAMNAWRRAGPAPGARVAIVGGGFFGLLLVQLCREIAGEIEVVSRRHSALQLAAQLGATRTWDSYDSGPAEESFDVVFEVTGHPLPLDLAARLCRVRGQLVIVGYHQDGHRSIDMQLWNWRGLDVINAHERDPAVYVRGLREAVTAVSARRLDPTTLLTHSFPLERLGDAYHVASERPDGFIKAVWRVG
jgi:threonine dehydrogenase-like Zn-dependent dehydrogenase